MCSHFSRRQLYACAKIVNCNETPPKKQNICSTSDVLQSFFSCLPLKRSLSVCILAIISSIGAAYLKYQSSEQCTLFKCKWNNQKKINGFENYQQQTSASLLTFFCCVIFFLQLFRLSVNISSALVLPGSRTHEYRSTHN